MKEQQPPTLDSTKQTPPYETFQTNTRIMTTFGVHSENKLKIYIMQTFFFLNDWITLIPNL